MNWLALTEIEDGCIPWNKLPRFSGLDPYLPWLVLTRFTRATPPCCPESLPYLVKVSVPPAQPAGAASKGPVTTSWANTGHLAGGGFLTAMVRTSSVLDLRPGWEFDTTPPSDSPLTIDFAGTLGLPRIRAMDANAPDALTLALWNRTASQTDRPVIAIIDDGCPFVHEAYRSADLRGSRVIYLWDQGTDGPQVSIGGWQRVPGFGYGRELTPERIEEFMLFQSNRFDGSIDEDACYADLEMDLVGASFRHGAHTMGIAAGAPNPVCPPEAEGDDCAAEADIIFVQLPRKTMADTSGGTLCVHVLDALRYIDQRTRVKNEVGGDIVRPVVVNLSIGASAGSHDGTALIEQAIDDFLGRRDDCAVVVAAGNARSSNLHATLSVPPGGRAWFYWYVAADDPSDSFMEVWLPADDDPAEPTHVSVRLMPPGARRDLCPDVGPGDVRLLVPPRGAITDAPICAAVNCARAPGGATASVVLLAVAPTASNGDAVRPLAPAGTWVVELFNQSTHTVSADAWIERDEPSFDGLAKQSEFADESRAAISNTSTLSSLAHGERAVVVGGYRVGDFERDDKWFRGELDEHSGEGPGRLGLGRPAPDLIAPSDQTPELPGILSYGVHSGEWNRMGGTSVAAAIATRRIYNDWCKLLAAGKRPGNWKQIKAKVKVDRKRDPTEPFGRVGRGRIKLVP